VEIASDGKQLHGDGRDFVWYLLNGGDEWPEEVWGGAGHYCQCIPVAVLRAQRLS
jgi:hypothetical protein